MSFSSELPDCELQFFGKEPGFIESVMMTDQRNTVFSQPEELEASLLLGPVRTGPLKEVDPRRVEGGWPMHGYVFLDGTLRNE